jgi:1,4-alpha-glucan branching enzyme
MIDEKTISSIVAANHYDPFSVLGCHQDSSSRFWVRAFLPGAKAVEAVDPSGSTVATMRQVHRAGFFEGECVGAKIRPSYRLKIDWHDGQSGTYGDAYAYGPQIPEFDLQLLSGGAHLHAQRVLGAHAIEVEGVTGVRFALWAPNARRVSVLGDFNQWDGRRHPMRLRHNAGVWEIFIPHVAEGDLYKYEILSGTGELLAQKADPYARAAQFRPQTASIVAKPLQFPRKLTDQRAAANRREAPMSIYEVHLGSWRRSKNGGFLNWDELAQTLPAYVADMGFTHVELLPISEHPFDGSWGYQTLGMFAPTARFGPPEGLARFIAACHAKGIGVLLDWVPAHFPTDAFGLAQFDGTALYEYLDPREGFHRDWNTLIYNFGRNEVRQFLTASALYWIQEHGVDGLRVDAVASMLYRDYSRSSGEWVPNQHGGRENLEAIALLRHINEVIGREAPGAITLAEESTAFPGVSAPTSAGGLGFHYKWNMGWMHDTLKYMQENPVHRKWHHNKMSFGLVYAFSENFVLPISHDEVVHGKGSMLGKMPGDDWQRFANLRAYYGFMWGHPGKKLLFMGQEFAQPEEWSHERELPWGLVETAYTSGNAPRHKGMQKLVRDLNNLYRKSPALHALDCDARGFEWIVSDDTDQSIFAWVRRDRNGHTMIVVCNFTPVARHGYRLGVPAEHKVWGEALNTDSTHYGGGNVGNLGASLLAESVPAHGRAKSIAMSIPPLATVFLTPL